MVSRRLLRIKIMQILFAFFKSKDTSFTKSEKELFFSIDKTYELYHYLMLLIIDTVRYFESKIDIARQKKIPTYEDLNPNMRFVNNKVVTQIAENPRFIRYTNNKKFSWTNHPELIRSLYKEIIKSDEYKQYMNREEDSYKSDKEIIINIYENHIANSELLYQILEEQSIYWNDDIEFVISMIIKTISGFKQNGSVKLQELYKNDDDISFVKTIFRKTIINHEQNIELIEKYIKNWDIDRIAFLDLLLIEMAITEICEIPTVPVKVSFNEYIEISKFYSTPKSRIFINGILDKIINKLKEDNKITKKGRGLIGEN